VENTDTAIFVLKILLALGPLALYFLILGLVNSQARPCLVSTRTDFILLVLAFMPVIAIPVCLLAGRGLYAWASAAVFGVVVFFVALMPRQSRRWVIYNCSPAQCRRLLLRACRRNGWQAGWGEDDLLKVDPVGLQVCVSSLPLLRSVTLHIQETGPEQQAAAERLIAMLRHEIRGEAMLPSATGASLVVLGTALLGLPMWYFFHHFNAIVEAVRRIFSA